MVRRSRRSLAVSLLIAAWLLPAAASAGTFVWSVDANGLWTDTTKWKYVPGSGPSGPSGAGYPTNPGDVAILGDETTAFTGPRTITIPNNVHPTVGVIGMKSLVSFNVVAGGANARLDLDNGPGGPLIYKQVAGINNDVIYAPIRLLGPLTVSVTAIGNSITLAGQIAEAGGSWSLTKKGTALLYLSSAGNAFTGTTTIEDGQLGLEGLGGPTILGDVTVGNGNAVGQTAKLVVRQPEQLADFARVQVNHDGQFFVQAVERIAGLVVNGGGVIVESAGPAPPGILTVSSLAMTGGVIDVLSEMRLEGDLTATSNAAGPALIRRPNTVETGALDLRGATRTFTVNQGPSAANDLDISVAVISAGNAGINKAGAGRMRFSGTADNKYRSKSVV